MPQDTNDTPNKLQIVAQPADSLTRTKALTIERDSDKKQEAEKTVDLANEAEKTVDLANEAARKKIKADNLLKELRIQLKGRKTLHTYLTGFDFYQSTDKEGNPRIALSGNDGPGSNREYTLFYTTITIKNDGLVCLDIGWTNEMIAATLDALINCGCDEIEIGPNTSDAARKVIEAYAKEKGLKIANSSVDAKLEGDNSRSSKLNP